MVWDGSEEMGSTMMNSSASFSGAIGTPDRAPVHWAEAEAGGETHCGGVVGTYPEVQQPAIDLGCLLAGG